jgi:DNA-directed RNA polymerase II subunit RPB1
LVKPVFHANLLDYIRKVLRMVCFSCSHLLADNIDNSKELKRCEDIRNEKSRFNAVFEMSKNLK